MPSGCLGSWCCNPRGESSVIDRPRHSDVIVVLSGDVGDVRFQHALNLFRSGYGQELILDAPEWTEYGRSSSDLAREYLSTAAADRAQHLHVCPFTGNSTLLELSEVSECLHTVAPNATTALIVTSTFHTRRSLSIAKRVIPRYEWSVAAAPDEHFGTSWWRKREWAKTTFTEWQKLGWWLMVEQWSAH